MGTLFQAPNDYHDHIIQDLKVTIQETKILLPSQETEKKSMFLSNIDQVLNFNVQTVHFFPPNPDFPPETVAETLESALGKVLVPYDYLAGRLKMNPQLGRFEIDCNAAGVGYVVASSEFTLKEIGDLVYPNPGFRQLIVDNIDQFGSDDQPLCIFQVTSFKCGGFAIGISTNHATFDGLSFKIFLQNLASQAADKPLALTPCNDRHLLAARSPPRVTFPHPELLKLKIPIGEEHHNNPTTTATTTTVFDIPQEDLNFQIFHLSSDDVAQLKAKAKVGTTNKDAKITGFNVVTAHVWRCKALSNKDSENNPDRNSTVLYAVDVRPRLNPPLPASYTGNAVLSAYATAPCHELKDGSFSRLVEMVTEGSTRMTDEYARSAIDWGEVYKGFPHGEFLVSSWWRLGFADIEYPWGKPSYSCPVVYHRKDIILLFPDMADNNGVNVLVALPDKEMKEFDALFHKFLA